MSLRLFWREAYLYIIMNEEKNMKYHIIKKSFGLEFCTWPDEIGLCVTKRLQDQIERARNILKYNRDIQKLYIEPPLKITSTHSFFDMQDACRFGIQSVVVEDIYAIYRVQVSPTNLTFAEYDFTHLIPHPLAAEHEEERIANEAEIYEEQLGILDPNILYEVQTLTASEGWLNTWSIIEENDETVPQTFSTRKAAQQEIDEHISDIKEAIESGDLDVMLDEFRIVQISKL